MTTADPRSPEHLGLLFRESEALLVIIGRGFGHPEGFDPFMDPLWFRRHFRDLRARHNLRSLFHGIMFRYPSPIMEWAFMGRLIHLTCGPFPARELMDALIRLISHRPTFVITTNTDGSLRAAGLGPEDLFEMAGNLTLMTCRFSCNDEVLPTDGAVRTMLAPGLAPTIAPEHVPRCPRCGSPMTPTIIRTERLALRTDWAAQCYRLLSFLRRFREKRLLVLEMNVSPWNTALKGIACHIAHQSQHACYLVVNDRIGYLPPRLHDRTVVFRQGASEAIALLLEGATTE